MHPMSQVALLNELLLSVLVVRYISLLLSTGSPPRKRALSNKRSCLLKVRNNMYYSMVRALSVSPTNSARRASRDIWAAVTNLCTKFDVQQDWPVLRSFVPRHHSSRRWVPDNNLERVQQQSDVPMDRQTDSPCLIGWNQLLLSYSTLPWRTLSCTSRLRSAHLRKRHSWTRQVHHTFLSS